MRSINWFGSFVQLCGVLLDGPKDGVPITLTPPWPATRTPRPQASPSPPVCVASKRQETAAREPLGATSRSNQRAGSRRAICFEALSMRRQCRHRTRVLSSSQWPPCATSCGAVSGSELYARCHLSVRAPPQMKATTPSAISKPPVPRCGTKLPSNCMSSGPTCGRDPASGPPAVTTVRFFIPLGGSCGHGHEIDIFPHTAQRLT